MFQSRGMLQSGADKGTFAMNKWYEPWDFIKLNAWLNGLVSDAGRGKARNIRPRKGNEFACDRGFAAQKFGETSETIVVLNCCIHENAGWTTRKTA